MQDADFLFLIAEISLGLAGFASIVAALGQRATRDHRALDASRLRGLLECSLLAVAFSMFPYVVSRFLGAGLGVWRVSGAFFAVAACAVATGMFMRRRNVLEAVPVLRRIVVMVTVLYLAPIPPLFLLAFGAITDHGAATYLACLLTYVVAAGLAFFRVMVSFIAAARE